MQPLYLWEGISTRRTLADVEGALRFLEDRWPPAFDGSDHHQAAILLGIEVLESDGSIDLFRAGLVAAAREAGILDEDPASNVVPLPHPPKRRR